MSRFAELKDKAPVKSPSAKLAKPSNDDPHYRKSREGKLQIAGYFSPDMRKALKICATRNDITLEALMIEAFDDVLRKYDESPIGG